MADARQPASPEPSPPALDTQPGLDAAHPTDIPDSSLWGRSDGGWLPPKKAAAEREDDTVTRSGFAPTQFLDEASYASLMPSDERTASTLAPQASDPDSAHSAPPEKIGRYTLEKPIGEGGLGTVYAANDPLLSRLIAIKVLTLSPDAEQRQAISDAFLNEARAAASLSHPHIVTVYDAGVSGDTAYIAMELLKGRDLRQLRRDGWRPTPEQSALIVRRIADALAYAHNKGIIHRDIKPANIFMVGRTQPRVLDFGIARITQPGAAVVRKPATRTDPTHPDTEAVAGSPYYMSPEQARGETVDRRSDVFSLGVVLYELLTDSKPFVGKTLEDISQAVQNHEPPLAHVLNEAIPRGLSLIAARAMEKSPDQRYASARALSQNLRQWHSEYEATQSRADGAANFETTQPLPGYAARAGLSARRLRFIAAGVVLAVGLVWWASRPHHTAKPNPQALGTAPAADGSSAGNAVLGDPTLPDAQELANRWPSASTRTARDKNNRSEADDSTAGAATSAANAADASQGIIKLAVTPWGYIDVDGREMGVSPPLTELKLPEGRHQITIRNDAYPPHIATITVSAGQSLNIKHKFSANP
jgi:serine/threonine protein kinase